MYMDHPIGAVPKNITLPELFQKISSYHNCSKNDRMIFFGTVLIG
jgi:hypothetical protein